MISLTSRLADQARRALLKSQLAFDTKGLDRAQYENLMARPAPTLDYVIYFTPRSGSSRITDIARKTGRLSLPGECFHPANVPGMARKLGARSLSEYVDVIRRLRNENGVFGCEVTSGMILRTFGSAQAFTAYFGAAPCFWLIREDVVAQAISMSKLKQTRVGHAAHSDAAERAAAEDRFRYDPGDIKRWVHHVLKLERETEDIFQQFSLSPLRISYEQMVALSEAEVANVIARHIGVPLIEKTDLATDHVKLGTKRNSEFAERFRAEHADFLAKVDAERAVLLGRLNREDV